MLICKLMLTPEHKWPIGLSHGIRSIWMATGNSLPYSAARLSQVIWVSLTHCLNGAVHVHYANAWLIGCETSNYTCFWGTTLGSTCYGPQYWMHETTCNDTQVNLAA